MTYSLKTIVLKKNFHSEITIVPLRQGKITTFHYCDFRWKKSVHVYDSIETLLQTWCCSERKQVVSLKDNSVVISFLKEKRNLLYKVGQFAPWRRMLNVRNNIQNLQFEPVAFAVKSFFLDVTPHQFLGNQFLKPIFYQNIRYKKNAMYF